LSSSEVVIDAPSEDLGEVAALIPRAEATQPGTRVVVFASARRGWLGRMLGGVQAPQHVLGTALLARGYVSVGAGEREGRACAWGESPAATEPSGAP
jgi:hypothetical protein